MAKDFSELIGLIHKKFKTRAALCEAIGKAPDWISRRLNGQTDFSSEDIILLVDALGIDPQDIYLYFLTPNVQ